MIKIDLCLTRIGFEMISTLLNCQDKYYEYGEEGLETNGLAIRGYESVLLVDLVDSYLFKVTNNKFKEVRWRVIYRCGRLLVFKGKRSISDIRIWRDKFIEKVNGIVGNNYLQYNCDTWNLGGTQ